MGKIPSFANFRIILAAKGLGWLMSLGLVLAGWASEEDYVGMSMAAKPAIKIPHYAQPVRHVVNGDDLTNNLLTINLQVTCFGSNNRASNYPLLPNNDIVVGIVLNTSPNKKILLQYPARNIAGTAITDLPIKIFTCTSATQADMECLGRTPATTGGFLGTKMIAELSGISAGSIKGVYVQQMPVSLDHAVAGNLSKIALYGKDYSLLESSTNNAKLDISIKIVGIKRGADSSGFCGNYVSPVMLFFDRHLPGFKNTSKFPLKSYASLVAWPEADHPGYFLFDQKKHTCVKDGTQLFGEDEQHQNGLEALRRWDTNDDQMISPKDKNFKYLALWQDKNGDGVCQKEEVFSLKQKKVKFISLDYRPIDRPFGQMAAAREAATFWYEDDQAPGPHLGQPRKLKQNSINKINTKAHDQQTPHLQRGRVFDIWLATLQTINEETPQDELLSPASPPAKPAKKSTPRRAPPKRP